MVYVREVVTIEKLLIFSIQFSTAWLKYSSERNTIEISIIFPIRCEIVQFLNNSYNFEYSSTLLFLNKTKHNLKLPLSHCSTIFTNIIISRRINLQKLILCIMHSQMTYSNVISQELYSDIIIHKSFFKPSFFLRHPIKTVP